MTALPPRFWAKASYDPSGCLLWTSKTNSDGYAEFNLGGKWFRGHRLAYLACIGPVPDGLVLDHAVCQTPRCVNPLHLEPVTNRENLRRHWALQTHCKNGHEWTPENTHYWRDDPRREGPRRVCRECARRNSAALSARRKQERQLTRQT